MCITHTFPHPGWHHLTSALGHACVACRDAIVADVVQFLVDGVVKIEGPGSEGAEEGDLQIQRYSPVIVKFRGALLGEGNDGQIRVADMMAALVSSPPREVYPADNGSKIMSQLPWGSVNYERGARWSNYYPFFQESTGDGNCMWRALLQALGHVPDEEHRSWDDFNKSKQRNCGISFCGNSAELKRPSAHSTQPQCGTPLHLLLRRECVRYASTSPCNIGYQTCTIEC